MHLLLAILEQAFGGRREMGKCTPDVVGMLT